MATRKTLITQDPRTMGVDPLAAAPVAKTTAVPTESKMSATEVAANNKEDVVLTNVERAFKLTDDGHITYTYAAGANKMPASHANHWFAKVHGTTII